MKVRTRFVHPTVDRFVEVGEDYEPAQQHRLEMVKNGLLEPETKEEQEIAPPPPFRPRQRGKARPGESPAPAEIKVDAPESRKPRARAVKKAKK